MKAMPSIAPRMPSTVSNPEPCSRGKSISAVVEDDGKGFTLDTTRREALGIVGMRERAALLGGRVSMESAPGAGTTLAVEVPLQ